MNVQPARSRTTAMAVSAVVHALMLTIVVLAWPRFAARSPAQQPAVSDATAARGPSASPAAGRQRSRGRVARSAVAAPGDTSPGSDPSARAFVPTDSDVTRVVQPARIPAAGTRVWLMPAAVETTRRSIEDGIFNHLWQSTLFAAVIGVLALAFRRHDARTRYWLWCVASAKFLVPIAALERIGAMVPLGSATPTATTPTAIVFSHLAEPFTRTAVSVGSSTAGRALDWWPAALWVLWLFGVEFVVLRRIKAWRTVHAAMRESRPAAPFGMQLPRGLSLRSSDTLLEPGTVGLWKPVLLVPAGIEAHLTAAELKSVIDHEACHVRCRDNLTAGIQMLVEAVFWFHPLVWWIGARMVDERERACDEHVLASVEDPLTYANAILHICQRFVYAGLASVPGVGGGDLRRRIERIMRKEIGAPVGSGARVWLAAAAVMAILLPVSIGAITTAPRVAGQTRSSTSPTSATPAFLAVSVKPNTSGDIAVRFTPDAPGRFTVINAPAALLIRFAYDLPDFEVSGGPRWLNTDRFDVIATVDGHASMDDRRLMLQRLFRDRFALSAHHESRQLPIYAMRLSSRSGALGPNLRRSNADCSSTPMLPLLPGRVAAAERTLYAPCGWFGMAPNTNLPSATGGLAFRGLTLAALAKVWTTAVHRRVVDETGLTGYFDGEFDFIAELPPPPPPPGVPNPFTVPFSSVFSVAPEQLGLKLEPSKGPVDVLVIDHVERPTGD